MSKRSYQQACALARALDVLGERWTLLVVRELMIGEKRFVDLHEGLPGIGTNLLSDRLKSLEEQSVIERRRLPPPAASTVYKLTAHGWALEPAVSALVRWGLSLDQFAGSTQAPAAYSRPEWDIVAIRALFDPRETAGVRFTAQFQVDEADYYVDVKDGALEVSLGEAEAPDLRIVTDRDSLIALTSPVARDAARSAGRMQVSGNERVLDLLTKMLHRPSIDGRFEGDSL